MGLPWDEAMVTWPKRESDLALPIHGNKTFKATRASSLPETVRPEHGQVRTARIPPADLRWLEREFAEFNRVNGYPANVPQEGEWPDADARAIPRFENTLRPKKSVMQRLSAALGVKPPAPVTAAPPPPSQADPRSPGSP
jgi:hypothetical protein